MQPVTNRHSNALTHPLPFTTGPNLLAPRICLRYAGDNYSQTIMDQHLTVKEAGELIGKSESTIKRLIREITTDTDHPDRNRILPSHDEVLKRREAGEPYVWKIDQTLLCSRYPSKPNEKPDSQSTASSATATAESHNNRIIGVLEESISVLKAELEAKNRQIEAFQERQREQNLLLNNLQERILIAKPEASTADASDGVVDRATESDDTRRSVSAIKHEKSRRKFWNRELPFFQRRQT
ncbi:MAG: hypothetical protein KDA96_07215 [Planctomycetaceae bacterium]|nr:hypothetical protein [Planctomycetaceae bacterium]